MDAAELRPGLSAGVGITVDNNREVVILVTVAAEAEEEDSVIHYAVAISPEVARHFGRTIRDMSREADKLQDELSDLDHEEVEDRLNAIRRRMANGDGS